MDCVDLHGDGRAGATLDATMDLDAAIATYEKQSAARASVKWARALALAGSPLEALPPFAKAVGGENSQVFLRYQKAVQSIYSGVGDPSLNFRRLHTEFLAVFVKETVLGRIPYVPVPPTVLCPIVTENAVADFVAETRPAPAVKLGTAALAFLGFLKLSLILGIARDLLLATDDRAVGLLERHLLRAARRGEDRALLSHDAAVAAERPAGLLFGLDSAGGGSPSSLESDLVLLWDSVRNGDPERPVFITSGRGAIFLGSLRNADGSSPFPNVSATSGGSIIGVPVVISPAAESKLVLLDAAALGVSDNGVEIEASQHATVEMDSAPVGGASNVVRSAFQENLSFIRINRFVDWSLAYADGVGYLDLPIATGSPA